jgi:hypothetical protein
MIKEALDGYARSPAMKKVFVMDRTQTVGASEIGQCARRMYYLKNFTDPAINMDPGHLDGWGARVRGSVMEEKFWVPAMRRRYRKNFVLGGARQLTVQDRYLSATPDGFLINQPRDALRSFGIEDIGPSQCIYVEGKTIDPRVNLVKEKEEHAFQVQTGMGLFRQKTIYKPDYAVISYIDASFWDDVDEWVIKFDKRVYDAGHERAVRIKTAGAPTELKPEGWIAGGKECEYCPFTRACGIVRRSVPEAELAADPQFKAEILDLCKEHQELDAKKTEAERALNEKKDEIKNRLREKSVRKLPGVVTWYPVKGKKSYDNAAIKQAAADAGIDVEQYCTTGEPTDALRVTVAAD